LVSGHNLKKVWNVLFVTCRNESPDNINNWIDHNNNKMERMNGEVRDREKVIRGLKIHSTAILPDYQIYHNYLDRTKH
ncbi:MAG: hypothetical protein WAM14_11245, partial [Candidatus Nitrosopolaris sp.]